MKIYVVTPSINQLANLKPLNSTQDVKVLVIDEGDEAIRRQNDKFLEVFHTNIMVLENEKNGSRILRKPSFGVFKQKRCENGLRQQTRSLSLIAL